MRSGPPWNLPTRGFSGRRVGGAWHREDRAPLHQPVDEQSGRLIHTIHVEQVEFEGSLATLKGRTARVFEAPKVGRCELTADDHETPAVANEDPDTGHCLGVLQLPGPAPTSQWSASHEPGTARTRGGDDMPPG